MKLFYACFSQHLEAKTTSFFTIFLRPAWRAKSLACRRISLASSSRISASFLLALSSTRCAPTARNSESISNNEKLLLTSTHPFHAKRTLVKSTRFLNPHLNPEKRFPANPTKGPTRFGLIKTRYWFKKLALPLLKPHFQYCRLRIF